MGRSVITRALCAIALLLTVQIAPISAWGEVFVSIGTGEPDGVYYPAAEGICDIVNRQISASGVRCSAETTPGSGYNIEAMRSGDLEMAIVQSDVLAAAQRGTGPYVGQSFPELRTVALLHPELVTIIVRADSGISKLSDLAGRRVNIGGTGSGAVGVWASLTAGWGSAKPLTADLRPDAAISALCRGSIDASLLVVGHPSAVVRAQFAACRVALLPVQGPLVDATLKAVPYYQVGFIPGRPYGLDTDVPTFGGRAVLVAPTWLDARVTSLIVRSMQANLAELRSVHPALANLGVEDMANQGLPAPLHPGAATALAMVRAAR
jgi:uncharacterized protein